MGNRCAVARTSTPTPTLTSFQKNRSGQGQLHLQLGQHGNRPTEYFYTLTYGTCIQTHRNKKNRRKSAPRMNQTTELSQNATLSCTRLLCRPKPHSTLFYSSKGVSMSYSTLFSILCNYQCRPTNHRLTVNTV